MASHRAATYRWQAAPQCHNATETIPSLAKGSTFLGEIMSNHNWSVASGLAGKLKRKSRRMLSVRGAKKKKYIYIYISLYIYLCSIFLDYFITAPFHQCTPPISLFWIPKSSSKNFPSDLPGDGVLFCGHYMALPRVPHIVARAAGLRYHFLSGLGRHGTLPLRMVFSAFKGSDCRPDETAACPSKSAPAASAAVAGNVRGGEVWLGWCLWSWQARSNAGAHFSGVIGEWMDTWFAELIPKREECHHQRFEIDLNEPDRKIYKILTIR